MNHFEYTTDTDTEAELLEVIADAVGQNFKGQLRKADVMQTIKDDLLDMLDETKNMYSISWSDKYGKKHELVIDESMRRMAEFILDMMEA